MSAPRTPDVEPPSELSSVHLIASEFEGAAPDIGRLSSPDGAVTLMLGDIADAHALRQQVGPDDWEQLLREHRALVDAVIPKHDGEVLKTEGEAFLASFRSAHAGVHAAVELMRAIAAPPEGEEHRLAPVRIGLHSGFVIANPEQLLGRNVVLASRIADRAEGGEILASDALKRYTEQDSSIRYEPRGEYHFRGVLGEHTVYAVRWR